MSNQPAVTLAIRLSHQKRRDGQREVLARCLRMVTAFTENMEHKNRNTVHAVCKDIEAKVSLYLQKAMAYNQPLRFGDENTADVRLNIIDSAGVEHPGNPLLLHSQVLKKAEFFETKLFQGGSSAKRPLEMKVTCSCDPESYIKCIQLMYSYDTEQQAQLRVLLSSLNINTLPDLAARLGMSQSKSDCEHLKMVTESLQELLQMAYHREELRSTVEQHIFDYCTLNTSPAIKDACRHAILNRFKAYVKAIKSKSDESSDLHWLLSVIRLRDAKLFETVVKEFCEDLDLRNAVSSGAVQNSSAAKGMLKILIFNILEPMGNGEIITPTSFRVDFLTNWTDTMVKLINRFYRTGSGLELVEKGIIGVAETLPLVEQKRIYSVCQGIFSKNSKSTSGLFTWWAEKVHDAMILDQL